MDIFTKQRELFFNNLLILGFDKASMEKKYRMTFDKDMFCIPNQKMFEVVTYFLFSKLNQVSTQQYSLPWPLLEKDQHRPFQKSCFNYLSSIALESDIKFPRFTSSLLSTFSGDRFYELYLAFSSHVVQRTISKNENVSLVMMPILSNQHSQDVVEVLKIATILSVEKFQEINSFSLNHFRLLLKCAREFVSHIQHFRMNSTTNLSLYQKNLNIMKTLYCDDQTELIPLNTIMQKSLKYEKRVKNLWLSFEQFLAKESKLWGCLSSEVEGNQDKFCLDGADFLFAISDNMKKCCTELNEIDTVVSNEEGKLCLLKYLKSFCWLLEFYLKTTIKGELLQVNDLCSMKNISSLKECLKHIESLNGNLVTNILPSMKNSTENLEKNLLLKEFSEDLKIFLKNCPSLSCCSTNFQNSISSSRSQTYSVMSLTGDACNSSLLFGDVYTKRLEDTSFELRSTVLENSMPDSQKFNNSNKNDRLEVELEEKKEYKLRKSWQLEESLNAMTLPDTLEFE